jgi:hypothetical protein
VDKPQVFHTLILTYRAPILHQLWLTKAIFKRLGMGAKDSHDHRPTNGLPLFQDLPVQNPVGTCHMGKVGNQNAIIPMIRVIPRSTAPPVHEPQTREFPKNRAARQLLKSPSGRL